MTTTSFAASRSVADHALGLCWGAWSELGVSGWARTHQQWAIDPEPLIIFTGELGELDPRLRDEATDWCIRYNRYVSRVRLRNLLRAHGDVIGGSWGEFAATVGAHAGVRWPGAAVERVAYRVTSRSSMRSLSEPSLVHLRMRALFGLGARTEILRHLLLQSTQAMTAAALGTAIGYTKRIVADECEILERAGILSVRAAGNRFYYSLARKEALRTFVGDLPAIRPDWAALLHMASVLARLDDAADGLPQRVLAVESRRAYREIQDDLETLNLPGPADRRGALLPSTMANWSRKTMSDFARGQWPRERESA